MPVIGLGSWTAPVEEVENALKEAIDVGYRSIDTAYTYQNEKGVGNAIKAKIQEGVIKREDIFVTTKLPEIGLRKSEIERFLKIALSALQLDYLDLYLIHGPVGLQSQEDPDNIFPMKDGKFLLDDTTNLEEVWQGMEAMVDAGLTKSIGVSNMNSSQIQRILNVARIKPANLQVECHAYLQQKKLREFCKSNGIIVTAYSPIGSPGKPTVGKKLGWPVSDHPVLLQDSVLNTIAKKNNRTPAQIFDFELDSTDMKALRDLERGVRYFDFDFFKDHPEFAFNAPF